MPLSPSRVQRIPPQALYFDGVDDYVDVKVFSFGQAFTVIALAFVSQRMSYGPIIVKDRDYSTRPIGTALYQIGEIREPSQWLFDVGDGSTRHIISSPYYTLTGRWWFLAGVFNSGALSLYVNGSLVASGSGVYKETNTGLRIGASLNLFHRFSGYIAQVLVYSRALSPEEIAWNHNYPDNPVRNGLVLWLHWDSIDVNAGVWYDKSGYGNHGTIYGATLVKIVKPPRRVLTPARVLAPRR